SPANKQVRTSASHLTKQGKEIRRKTLARDEPMAGGRKTAPPIRRPPKLSEPHPAADRPPPGSAATERPHFSLRPGRLSPGRGAQELCLPSLPWRYCKTFRKDPKCSTSGGLTGTWNASSTTVMRFMVARESQLSTEVMSAARTDASGRLGKTVV